MISNILLYDELWMHYAITLAQRASKNNEIPIGSVIVLNNKILSKGWNCSISCNDPTAHAEIIALRLGGKKLKNYRLLGTSLYVTLEPCIMCIGAMIHARINRLVFGAYRTNSFSKEILTKKSKNFNHKIEITSGILEKKCSEQLKKFFYNIRLKIIN